MPSLACHIQAKALRYHYFHGKGQLAHSNAPFERAIRMRLSSFFALYRWSGGNLGNAEHKRERVYIHGYKGNLHMGAKISK